MRCDIVVIAASIRTSETGIRTELRELKPAFPVIELQTEFKVLSIFRGDVPQQTFMLRHYRTDHSRVRDGLMGGVHALSVSERSQYLLFLRRDEDKALIPASGHVFPGDSVIGLRKASKPAKEFR
jgi:hypothetical protein